MSNRLYLHAGASEISFTDLASIPAPTPTDTWHPIPHSTYVTAIRDSISLLGGRITSEHLAVKPGTDLVVALAIHRFLFEEGLADEAFLREQGLDDRGVAGEVEGVLGVLDGARRQRGHQGGRGRAMALRLLDGHKARDAKACGDVDEKIHGREHHVAALRLELLEEAFLAVDDDEEGVVTIDERVRCGHGSLSVPWWP